MATTRRDEKKKQAREAILQAATAEFNERGFILTSVSKIMRRANLAVGTFYNYFPTKDDVLLELLKPLVNGVRFMIETGIAGRKNAIDLLEESCDFVANYLDDHRFVLPLFLGERKGAPGFHKPFEELLKMGQIRKEIREDIPPELIVEMFHSIYQAASFSKLPISFKKNIQFKIKILIDGIRVNPERESQ